MAYTVERTHDSAPAKPVSFWRIVIASGIVGFLVIGALYLLVADDPPYKQACKGACAAKEAIERGGAAAVECGTMQKLLEQGIEGPDTWCYDNNEFTTADWSWSGTLTPWGGFVGEIRVDGRARRHGRSFVFVFEQESADSEACVSVKETSARQ